MKFTLKLDRSNVFGPEIRCAICGLGFEDEEERRIVLRAGPGLVASTKLEEGTRLLTAEAVHVGHQG